MRQALTATVCYIRRGETKKIQTLIWFVHFFTPMCAIVQTNRQALEEVNQPIKSEFQININFVKKI